MTSTPGDPLTLARLFVQIYLEVAAGRRPPRHLALMTHRDIAPARPGRGLGRIVASRGSSPHPDTYEAAVLVRQGNGALSFVALRLERRGGKWKVCALEDSEAATERFSSAA